MHKVETTNAHIDQIQDTPHTPPGKFPSADQETCIRLPEKCLDIINAYNVGRHAYLMPISKLMLCMGLHLLVRSQNYEGVCYALWVVGMRSTL